MTNPAPGNRRTIKLKTTLPEPRLRAVKPRSINDYPEVPAAYLAVANRYSNPLLLGPPICDEFIALIRHMFTEEEAWLVQHLGSPRGKTATAVAKAVHRPVERIQPILDHLANQKHILITYGRDEKKRYGLLPIVPGVFESVLVRTSLDSLTPWHRRFAELFEALYETGYLLDYAHHALPAVRYLPVDQTISHHSLALPSDRLEAVLDPYKRFAVGLCQCRMTEELVGRGCGRSMENCLAFGDGVEFAIRSGRMREVSKRDALAIKTEAEANGLVTFIAEATWGQGAGGGASCSCCGCCCHALQTITKFNTPGLIAPPHFRPQISRAACTCCGKCARRCPMGAIVVDAKAKTYRYLPERCIGCGLCAAACDKQRAIRMEPVEDYRPPPRQLRSILWRIVPNYLRNAWSVWRKRR